MQLEIIEQETNGFNCLESTLSFQNRVNAFLKTIPPSKKIITSFLNVNGKIHCFITFYLE